MIMRPNMRLAFALAVALLAPSSVLAADLDPRVPPLQQRLDALSTDPRYADLAGLQHLHARQAVDALAVAKKRDRELAAYVADRRVEIAETIARAQAADHELQALDDQRTDLLLQISRRETERARQEAERLRIQAQIQAEQAAQAQQEAQAEAQARQEAEDALSSATGKQSAKLSATRQKQASLAREAAELMSGAKLPASRFNDAGEVFTFTGAAFAAGKSGLSSEAAGQAKALAAYLQTTKGKATVQAYDANPVTAQARADALRAALVAEGVPSSRVKAAGKKAAATKARSAEVTVAQ